MRSGARRRKEKAMSDPLYELLRVVLWVAMYVKHGASLPADNAVQDFDRRFGE